MHKNENQPQIMYILPNLFTAASCFLGIISVIASFNGQFMRAIFFILIALIFDGLDGRVARMTNTTSRFGVEFDSLADLIAFGVAPAALFYVTVGRDFGRVGSLLTAIFVVFGAIRLARFNVTTGTYDPRYFIGLPIPTAAVTAAFWIGFYLKYDFMKDFAWIFLGIMPILAILMVSNVRYPSFKKMNLKKANFLKVLILLFIFFSLFYLGPIEFMVTVTTIYIFYGLFRLIYRIWRAKFKKKIV